tara:strand:- start:11430 stop:12287 length:858 start_codon:yes stop_codon:yes gene_type:complete
MKKYFSVQLLLCFCVVFVAYVGAAGFFFIASSYAERVIQGRVSEPFDTSIFGLNEPILTRSQMIVHSDPKSPGVLMQIYGKQSDGLFYVSGSLTLKEALGGAFSPGLILIWDDPLRPFFLIPLAIHVCAVVVFRILFKLRVLKRTLNRRQIRHIALSLLGLVAIVWCVQLAHVVWANERWGVGAYLNDGIVGPIGLKLLYALGGLSYVYVLYVTSQVRHLDDGVRRCAGCGYEGIGDSKQCSECGRGVEELQRGKRGGSLAIFFGMLVFMFFSPVLVSSVYSVMS